MILELCGFVFVTILPLPVVNQCVYLSRFSRYLNATCSEDSSYHTELPISSSASYDAMSWFYDA